MYNAGNEGRMCSAVLIQTEKMDVNDTGQIWNGTLVERLSDDVEGEGPRFCFFRIGIVNQRNVQHNDGLIIGG
jgi:hypothetical protein